MTNTEGTAMSTRETTPLHIWKDSVHMGVIAKVGTYFRPGVATGEWLMGDEHNARIVRAYNAGEPVWMVVDEFIQRAKGAIIAHVADADLRVIRKALARS